MELRSRAGYGVALLRLADGNRRGADSALRAGMRMLSRYRAALGATELRVNAAGHAADLARLGLGLAVEEGDATRALAWAERWRAGTLGLRPERPPDDVELAADLAELRRVTGEVREAAAAGRDTTRLLNRQGALEEAVRRRAHRTPGQDLEPMELEPAMGTLGVALGERALIEIAALHGELHAVVVADGRARLRQLGQLADVSGELANLLKGEDARVDAVAAALDGAGLGHVAAHGRFRADNPFFLLAAAGRWATHRLRPGGPPPRPGTADPFGLRLGPVGGSSRRRTHGAGGGGLLARHADAHRSVVSISDTATRPLMLGLHAGLRAGLAPTSALVQAQAHARAADDDESLAASMSFVCFGAG